jgi:hypothetical protein
MACPRNERHTPRSLGLQAFCSISSRRQLAVVMGNEEPDIKDAAVSRMPHFRLLASRWARRRLFALSSFVVVPLI